MAGKQVAFKPKPGAPASRSAEEWVARREAKPEEAPMKRLTIDVPLELHKRIKASCASRGIKMADEIRALLERQYADEP